jgi:hypothetical protein
MGDPTSAGFTISRDNVLEIGRAFVDEADRLQGRLQQHRAAMFTQPALGDPASADFAGALNTRLVTAPNSYVNRAQAYIDELRRVADQCAAAAKDYGFTEERIAAAMSGTGASLA